MIQGSSLESMQNRNCGYSVVYWAPREMHNNNLGLGLFRVSSMVRVSIRVKVRISIMVRVSIRTSWVVNFALFRYQRPVIYTRPGIGFQG